MILLCKNTCYILSSRMLRTQILCEANPVFNAQPKHLGASGHIFIICSCPFVSVEVIYLKCFYCIYFLNLRDNNYLLKNKLFKITEEKQQSSSEVNGILSQLIRLYPIFQAVLQSNNSKLKFFIPCCQIPR